MERGREAGVGMREKEGSTVVGPVWQWVLWALGRLTLGIFSWDKKQTTGAFVSSELEVS